MNYKHLHYFWAAANAGGVMAAGEQLHISPQTLSGQIKLLEERLGTRLFRKRGRGLELTPEGRIALKYADQIFSLGKALEETLGRGRGRDAPAGIDFRVGLADAVPKAVAYRLLEPALAATGSVRLICGEGRIDDLLAQMSVHKVDVVIADEPMRRDLSVKAFNHELGSTGTSFFATTTLKGSLVGRFPTCLNAAPMMLPAAGSALRRHCDQWLAKNELRPEVAGEFADSALIAAFGREGRGVFMAPTLLERETCAEYGVKVLGRVAELRQEFYAISIERRITHPCVEAITSAARGQLFVAERGPAQGSSAAR